MCVAHGAGVLRDRPGVSATRTALVCSAPGAVRQPTRRGTRERTTRGACDDAADVTSMKRELGGLLATALLIAVVVVAWRFTVSVQRASARAAAGESAAATVQADVAVGHVWLEELLAGDRTVDVRRYVRGPFIAASAGCRAPRGGGPAAGGGPHR